MPVLNGARAWLETATTLKVPEFQPFTEEHSASSFIAARPGEAFSLRYDHIPVEGYDLAWRLRIQDEHGNNAVEQWGGPPMEMRKSRGVVKVRAMRISEDGTRFREFAWADNDAASLSGTITLSLHLCHFAEATTEVAPTTASSNMIGGSNNALGNTDAAHPVLAPPTVRPQKSKLWTWYWRNEEPKDVFVFKFGRKEKLQADGIIPAAVPSIEPSAVRPSPPQRPTHQPKMSTGSLFNSSPRDLIKRKQSLSISKGFRSRGYSSSSTESSLSASSEELEYE